MANIRTTIMIRVSFRVRVWARSSVSISFRVRVIFRASINVWI